MPMHGAKLQAEVAKEYVRRADEALHADDPIKAVQYLAQAKTAFPQIDEWWPYMHFLKEADRLLTEHENTKAGYRLNPMNPPPDEGRGLRAYEMFTKHEPSDGRGLPHITIPTHGTLLGYMTWITYDSDKWEPSGKWHPYIHPDDDRRGRVKVVVVDKDSADLGKPVAIPSYIRNSAGVSPPTATLAMFGQRKGHFTGCGYYDPEAKEEYTLRPKAAATLWFPPSKDALVVLRNKDKQPLFIMWGGKMRITARGIVG